MNDTLDDVLWGLAVGDAYGELFATNPAAARLDALPPPLWPTTDDTAMALAVADTLRLCGRIDPDVLALVLARRFAADPGCGYGGGTRRILTGVREGRSWRRLSMAAYGGEGSKGNGAAVRAAPVGAYFCDARGSDRMSHIAEEARQSARPTHSHQEALEGAAAVALAVAAARCRLPVMTTVINHLYVSEVRARLIEAATMPDGSAVHAARILGSGQAVTAPDTVPFALWMATTDRDTAACLRDAARVGGDTDTVCAIIGAIRGAPAGWAERIAPLRV